MLNMEVFVTTLEIPITKPLDYCGGGIIAEDERTFVCPVTNKEVTVLAIPTSLGLLYICSDYGCEQNKTPLKVQLYQREASFGGSLPLNLSNIKK